MIECIVNYLDSGRNSYYNDNGCSTKDVCTNLVGTWHEMILKDLYWKVIGVF